MIKKYIRTLFLIFIASLLFSSTATAFWGWGNNNVDAAKKAAQVEKKEKLKKSRAEKIELKKQQERYRLR